MNEASEPLDPSRRDPPASAPEAASPLAEGREAPASPEVQEAPVIQRATASLLEEKPEKPARKDRYSNAILEVGMVVALALFLALLLKVYVAEAYEIRGRSMMPTLEEDQRVMILKVFYEIHRGDIIIFSSAENPKKDLIKRVIGLPGDCVEVRNGIVYVNGQRLDEPYARPGHRWENFKEPPLKPGQYYVLGDNRPDSQDSRVFHAISGSSIKGKVVLRWWPLEKLGSL